MITAEELMGCEQTGALHAGLQRLRSDCDVKNVRVLRAPRRARDVDPSLEADPWPTEDDEARIADAIEQARLTLHMAGDVGGAAAEAAVPNEEAKANLEEKDRREKACAEVAPAVGVVAPEDVSNVIAPAPLPDSVPLASVPLAAASAPEEPQPANAPESLGM